jgi:hypothetical protein
MKIVDWKKQILKENNSIERMVIDQDKPSIDLVTKVRDLKTLVKNWTQESDNFDMVKKEL